MTSAERIEHLRKIERALKFSEQIARGNITAQPSDIADIGAALESVAALRVHHQETGN
jgi:hypothetical protein